MACDFFEAALLLSSPQENLLVLLGEQTTGNGLVEFADRADKVTRAPSKLLRVRNPFLNKSLADCAPGSRPARDGMSLR